MCPKNCKRNLTQKGSMLMGYCQNSKDYRFIDLITKIIKGDDVMILKNNREATEGTQNIFKLVNDSQEENAKTIKIEKQHKYHAGKFIEKFRRRSGKFPFLRGMEYICDEIR